ncbi:MAG: LTA synthase family protein [Candidatus Saccharibacteria bacterium]|nr:LTA synthase family protein [Candidatus Saccharibacteria bacterium]
MKEKLGKIFKHKATRAFFRLVFIALTAILIMFFIEMKYLGNDFNKTIEFMTGWRTEVFFYSALIIFFLELIISAPFKTAFTGPAITFILAIILSYISNTKMAFRGQPLLPEDLKLADQAGTLTRFIDVPSVIKLVLGCILVMALAIVLNIVMKKIFGSVKEEEGNKIFKNFRLYRVLILIVGVVGFMSSANFAINHNPKESEEQIPWLKTNFLAWNQRGNYDLNGPVLGFLYNIKKVSLEEPEGYLKEKIAEIKKKYSEDSGEKLSDSDVNIVMILNETFYDMDIIANYYPVLRNKDLSVNSMGVPVTEEIIPTVKKLIREDKENAKVATGQMYSTDYGGGTANIEFEADTSMSNFWMNLIPYTDVLSHVDSVPSVASVAKSAGYDTVAIHPFNGGMYKRSLALSKEGFDEFITENEMRFDEKDENRPYINDRAAYKETMKVLEEHEEKTLISLITMQNHMGYEEEEYSTRSYQLAGAPKAGEDLSPFTEEEKTSVEVYLETLHNSDYYLAEFLDNLSKSDEKTVVLFYGDHAPGILSRVKEAEDKNISDLAQVTPYFVWANFELEESEEVASKNFGGISGTTLPTTTPNCFVPTMFNLLGVSKPSFINLTSEVCKVEPILTRIYFGSEKPKDSEALSDYELYIYDILGGERFWYQ